MRVRTIAGVVLGGLILAWWTLVDPQSFAPQRLDLVPAMDAPGDGSSPAPFMASVSRSASSSADAVAAPARDPVAIPPTARAPVCILTLVGIDPAVPWTGRLQIQFSLGQARISCDVAVDAHGVARLHVPIGAPSLQNVIFDAEDSNYRLVDPERRIESIAAGGAVEIVVEPVGVLRGRVLGPDGNGFAARVQAFRWDASEPQQSPLASGFAKPDGSYSLRLPPALQVLLVADAALQQARVGNGPAGGLLLALEEEEGEADTDDSRLFEGSGAVVDQRLLPAWTRMVAVHGEPRHAPDLHLGAAARLTGRLTGAGGQPVAGVELRAQPAGTALRSWHPLLRWSPTHGIVRSGAARTDVDGGFCFWWMPGASFTVVATGEDPLLLAGEPSATATAPGHLELVAPGQLVSFVITAGGAPVADTSLSVGERAFRVAADGRMRAMLPAGPMHVRAIHGTRGMASVDLPASGRPAVVELPLTDAGLAPVRFQLRVAYGWVYPSFEWQPRPGGPAFTVLPAQRERDGPFELSVPPGSYRLVVREHEHNPGDATMVPLHLDVEVPAEGLTLTAEASAGGRLLLEVLAADGTLPSGRFRLRQAGRDVIPRAEATGVRGEILGAPGELLPGVVNRLATPLPPGDYLLTVAVAGHAEAEQRVAVRAEATTTVVVRLR
ncbi:MAG: hypothetical protein MUC36_21915 [Planctomycetes bacterium]|jgi:hypothetical protein|nr:hypothetical protein [Planctomycetota bacterium]